MNLEELYKQGMDDVRAMSAEELQSCVDKQARDANRALRAYDADGSPQMDDAGAELFGTLVADALQAVSPGFTLSPTGFTIAMRIKTLLDLAHWVGFRKGQAEALERLMGE